MALYKVHYEGFYLIEAETIDEAMETTREDYESQYEEWQNTKAVKVGE